MADADELRRVLEQHTQADVTLVYRRFRETMQSEDLGQFVQYMVAQGLLPAAAAPNVVAELRAGANEPTIVERRQTGSGSHTSRDASTDLPAPRSHATSLRLLEVIGRGGMGLVYRGEQVELGRQVAFKQLLEGGIGPTHERFLREARLTAQLDHPNIVPIHMLELADDGSAIGYAMKLVEGKTLRTLLSETIEAYERKRPIDTEHALTTRLEHFLKICDAMAFAHSRGILHRDLKPANFMIGKFGEVYVMDWGVARIIGSREREPVGRTTVKMPIEPDLTQVGDIIGSPSYMSPEQADGRNEELDASADQYALGLILFEIVSLRRAVDGTSTAEVFTLAAKGEKAPLVHVSKHERISSELRAIIAKATAFLPADRYPSVTALAEDVRRYMRGDAVAAKRDNPLLKLWRLMSRHRRSTAVVFLGVLALSAIAVTWTSYRRASSELALRDRSERVTALTIDVAAQAHQIDAQFRSMEAALEGLRAASEWALTGPEPPADKAPLFFTDDFANPSRRPKDFTEKTKYRWPVSLDYPVVGISPGTDRAAVTPSVRRLSPVGDHMRFMIIAASGKEPASLTAEERTAILRDRVSPIDYAYVDLPEGVHYVYPGIDSLPPEYDVRTAGFYTMSANKHGRRWGAPYVDSTTDEQGDDLVLPCTQGLWSPAGKFLGVAGVEITVTKIVERGLAMPRRATIRTSLVDSTGKKVIDSGDAGKRFKASGKDESLELHDFDIPEVVEAVRAGKEGLLELDRGGRRVVVVFVRLDVLGWFYVVEVDAKTLGAP